MADLSGTGRALSGTYRGARFGKKVWTQRQWFKYLLYRSVLVALLLEHPEVENQRVREAALRMCQVLKRTPVPMESDGFFARVAAFFRRRFTRGMRYPEYRGPLRDSFRERLLRWARAAAASEPGKEALDYACFPGGSEQAELFARRLRQATALILNDPTGAPTDALNHVRDEMWHDLEIGLNDAQIQNRIHNRNAALRGIAASAAGATLSTLGFHNDASETLGFALVGAGASLTVDYAAHGVRRTTQKMVSARRQALSWLLFLTRRLVEWREVQLPERDLEEEWRLYLPRVLDFLVSEDPSGFQEVLLEWRSLERVGKLIETAERSADEDLSRLLTDIETVLEFEDLRDFPDAIRNLLYLVRDVSPRSGGYSRPEIEPGSPPLQLPPIPDELE